MELIKRKITNFSLRLISKTHQNPKLYSTNLKSTTLFDKIEAVRDPNASITPILDQWGNVVDRASLRYLVRLLKDQKRFYHALQMSDWMCGRKRFRLSGADLAIRLELMHRIHGLKSAETFFENLLDSQKTLNVYRALLVVYVWENSVQKAEALMEEMREKGMETPSFFYDAMINLYRKTESFEKIEVLMEEMKRNGIHQSKYTMRNLMVAYGAASNISEMESILNQFENDSRLELDWNIYTVAANGYLKVGLIDKALTMLTKAETIIPDREKRFSFNHLVSLYAEAGKKDEVYRVWHRYKPETDTNDALFCAMIDALSKMDEIEGADKIFGEWESQCRTYNFSVLNRLLSAYFQKGLIQKAEVALEKATQGRNPCASTWNTMAKGYISQNQMSKAVEMLKRAMSVSVKGSRTDPKTLTACLDYLEEQGDGEGMEEIIKLLESTGEPLTRDLYRRLVRTYSAAGIPDTKVLMDANEETSTIEDTPDRLVS